MRFTFLKTMLWNEMSECKRKRGLGGRYLHSMVQMGSYYLVLAEAPYGNAGKYAKCNK
jgi:hypothetical protein